MESRKQDTNSSDQTNSLAKFHFDRTQTVKPVLAIKTVTKEPEFWQKKGSGTRNTPLTKGDHAKIFLTSEELKKVYERPDVDKILAAAVRERWINKFYQK